ncbi:hypothetical protein BN1723_007519 [Verticillium longisporum]|uniref:sterol 3beta-glucosyltransferase n=1 Tax=Verticillium longisporum TaxID=100787 RepID=A0A0G4NLN0_VERLO|nr:hypothetical protein BN1723_007519 [Verticillium longisporum]
MAPTHPSLPPISTALPPTTASLNSAQPTPTPTDEDPKKRVARKLRRKRRNETYAMDLPERLKGGNDSEDEEDLMPAGNTQNGPPMFMNMNQSIFGLIAAAGSRVDFHDRFEGQSSDDDDESGHQTTKPDKHTATSPRPESNLSKTTVIGKATKERRHRRSGSAGNVIARSLQALPRLGKRRSKKESSKLEPPSEDASESSVPQSSQPESAEEDQDQYKLAPVMSRMLEARADVASRPSFDLDRLTSEHSRRDSSDLGPSPLALRLAEIFEFTKPEEVIEEYPCWLLQSVLLQGYMYITARHICFYAYLPKKAHEVVKSGYLSKSGKRNPKYNRYWFRMKGDVLTYYRDPSNVYFPSGQIDLRYGISASITDKDKAGLHLSVTTSHRTYHFRADSAPSAKEWVKSLQRVIFRSHNDGDSVKISMPIENVIDIEDSQMLQFADTCKIRVIDNDQTYAIDEYFFSFFSFGKEAINVLKIMFEGASAETKDPADLPKGASARTSIAANRRSIGPDKIGIARLPENVKATLSPMSPTSPLGPSPRPSADVARPSMDAFRVFGRKSLDLSSVTRDASPRRSFSGSRSHSRNRLEDSRNTVDKNESSDSYVQSSMEDPSFSAMAASSNEDASASQILHRSDVFQSPTMRRSGSRTRHSSKKTVQGTQSPPALATYSGQHAATTGSIADDPNKGPSLQSITKMGAYPLQRVGAFAEYLNSSSRRMSSMLATESMGYVEKVSGMWKGNRKHYDAPPETRTDDEDLYEDSEGRVQLSTERFRAHFALPETEKLQVTYYGFLFQVLPLYGKIYISDRFLCFRSLLPGTRTKLILPLKDIENVDKEKGFRFGYSGLVPFLYNFSPSVVAPPLDFSDWIRVTGYWFLDEATKWEPPKELTDFIAQARADDKKLVYVGFGSIIVNDTAKMTQEVIDAVLKADVRCILSKGWSDRVANSGDAGTDDAAAASKREEPVMPPEIHVIKSAPHDWLFSQIDAAAHHGGSGTTGASLRAGIPTIIRPFFGDQFFFGNRVEDIGVGICLKKWGATSFARALWEATHNERMIIKARVLGEQIRKENGVESAIQCIYRDMEYATSLVKRKGDKNRKGAQGQQADARTGSDPDADADEEEESWTFIGGDEPDPDVVTQRLSAMHASASGGHVPGMGTLRADSKSLGSKVLGSSPGSQVAA